MTESISLPRPELVQTADMVAREKQIEKAEVFDAMEQAIAKASRSKYGHEIDIIVKIDPKTGAIEIFRRLEVVKSEKDVEDDANQIPLKKAQKKDKEAKVGDYIYDRLPPIDFGRSASQTAKQVIVQKVRESEREKQYEEFKDRVGDLISGIVRRTEYGNVFLDIGRGEGILRREELIPREILHNGDRVRAYIMDIRKETRGPQVFLSRTHPQFMAKLFMQEVPEIYDGLIEIKSVARDPGSRAKIAVSSTDSSFDPVGACVGMRGSRVQAVVSELQGEKIDIVPWAEDIAKFVVSALAPANVTKVVLDEDTQRTEVVVPEDQLSLAIGRRGQNVRLASMLTGWHIDVLTEDQESERRQEEFKTRSSLFIKALDVDDVIAYLLVTEGFTSLEEVAFVPLEELSGIEGFDSTIASELQERAKVYVEKEKKKLAARLKKLGIKKDLSSFEGLSTDQIIKLGEATVRTLDDLADLASDELIEILGEKISVTQANKIIMDARAHWFESEDDVKDEDHTETEDVKSSSIKKDKK